MVLLFYDDDVPPLLVDDDGVFNTSNWFQVRGELDLALPIDQPHARTIRCRHLLWTTYAYDDVPSPLVITCDNHSPHHTAAILPLMAMATEVMRGPISPCNSNHEEQRMKDSPLPYAGWAFAWAFFHLENF